MKHDISQARENLEALSMTLDELPHKARRTATQFFIGALAGHVSPAEWDAALAITRTYCQQIQDIQR